MSLLMRCPDVSPREAVVVDAVPRCSVFRRTAAVLGDAQTFPLEKPNNDSSTVLALG